MKRNIWIATCLTLTTQACATPTEMAAARLDRPTPATLEQVKSTIGKAMGRARIELGPVDFATSTSLFVLPLPLGPYETRSLAVPTVFDIKRQGQACFLVRRDTGQTMALDGVTCIAMPGRPHAITP